MSSSTPCADNGYQVRSVAVEIDAPASLVWHVLTDTDNYNAWNPHCVRIDSTLKMGDPVAMTLVSYTTPGRLEHVVEYLCAFEPEKLLSWEMQAAQGWPYQARRDQVLEAAGENRCRYFSTDTFFGDSAVHVMNLTGVWVKRAFDDVAIALKERAEELYRRPASPDLASPAHEQMRDTMLRYAELLSSRDVDGIVALFADGASLEDPVGSQPLVGYASIRQFYEAGIDATGGTMRMQPEGSVRVVGNEAACAMIVTFDTDEGQTRVETMDTMVFDAFGKIQSLRAHVGPLNFHPPGGRA
ncbi:nuclear transport factor 2 family protein [Parahaliea aestuarii]|uniref:SnoaL-like domain-containing protein n=1 Tax=Parahaliea aestuarii TaxID=1852021 RepID=A0A5C8ZVE1_9GAMM|nr:nuclear transport factor 2 family protein [Parahaliea aestuarii]TXS91799.1 hypothetical protein FVW59_11660 [Parahaliea aestuarii]